MGIILNRRLAAAVFIAVLAFCPFPASVHAAPQSHVQELRDSLDLNFFDRYWSELDSEVREYMPGLSWEGLMDRMQEGEPVLDPTQIIGGVLRFFMGEVMLNLKLTGQLLLLVVAAAFLKNLETAFEREQIAALTRTIIFVVLIGICLYSFNAALTLASAAINNMVDFSLAMLPMLLALLASQGSVVSSAMLHPLVVFGVSFFGMVIRGVIFPLIFFSAVLGLANHFSPHFKVGKLSDFLKDISVWGLGICMTIFVGILAVQGTAGTISDAVTLRTAKYMTGAFVPVVGKMLSDAVETVAGASIILKNGIYLVGIVVLLFITLTPLLKVAAMAIVFKLTAALVQPLGENNLGDCINTMGNCLVLVLGALAAAALLFFLAVTIVVGAGNVAIMLR